jgi:hypothetical protein
MSTPLSLTAASLTRGANGVKQERISGGAFSPRRRATGDRHTASAASPNRSTGGLGAPGDIVSDADLAFGKTSR